MVLDFEHHIEGLDIILMSELETPLKITRSYLILIMQVHEMQ